jgi:hypothetical protein
MEGMKKGALAAIKFHSALLTLDPGTLVLLTAQYPLSWSILRISFV